jgi:hypothetical protein
VPLDLLAVDVALSGDERAHEALPLDHCLDALAVDLDIDQVRDLQHELVVGSEDLRAGTRIAGLRAVVGGSGHGAMLPAETLQRCPVDDVVDEQIQFKVSADPDVRLTHHTRWLGYVQLGVAVER